MGWGSRTGISLGATLICVLALRAADAPVLQKPILTARYAGGYPNDYPAELQTVQLLLRTAPQDIASQLGLIQYREGFQHPVTVRFDDGAPALAENPFFYLDAVDPTQSYSQTLVVNVEAFARLHASGRGADEALRQGFYYTMTSLILNDLSGGQADLALPIWVREGSAVFLSGMGDDLVKKAAAEVPRSRAGELADDLNRPFPILTRRQYARYYLAVKYLVDKGGMTGYQMFIRDLLNHRPISDAIQNALAQDWPTFQRNVRSSSTEIFRKYASPDE